MPVYRREGSPYWWYSFTINGRRFRGSTGRETKREAEEVERDEYSRIKRSASRGADWTLQVVLSTYWNEHARLSRDARTVETHFANIQAIIGKDVRTSRLTNGALMDYRARRRGSKTPRGTFVTQHSINRELAYLRAAFEHCRRFHGLTMPDVDWKGLKAKEPPHRVRFLSRDEYAKLMEAAHDTLRPIIAVAVGTGLRQGNLLRLDWKQVRLDAGVIEIPRAKSGRSHVVRLSAAVRAVLATTPPAQRKGPVFDLTNFRRRWSDALDDAGIEDFRFHDLRHTFASWARQAGADLADICEALGHSSITMTLR
jgi:integrase